MNDRKWHLEHEDGREWTREEDDGWGVSLDSDNGYCHELDCIVPLRHAACERWRLG